MSDKPQALIHVVEDDAAVSRVITATLERFGYRHAAFSTGGDFLRQLRVQVPDVAILDLGLPDMDGMEVLQQLRSRYRFGLLIATGRDDTHDRVMGLELGADDYVVKPFEPRELIARVRSILRRRSGGSGNMPLDERRPAERISAAGSSTPTPTPCAAATSRNGRSARARPSCSAPSCSARTASWPASRSAATRTSRRWTAASTCAYRACAASSKSRRRTRR